MILRRRSACAGNRAALLDFVDRGERGPATDVALAHLDRCRSCEAELSEIALAITVLRRIRAEVQLVEPSREAWERVRLVTVRRPAAPWRWRVSLGASLVAAALSAVVVMPVAFGRLAAPGPPMAGDAASGAIDGRPAGAAPGRRIYDPPARSLTARLVTILARDERIDHPREVRPLTFLPAATDRFELERARRWGATPSEETPIHAATRD